MKKFLSMLLVICMVLSMGAIAEADVDEIEEAVEFDIPEIADIEEWEDEPEIMSAPEAEPESPETAIENAADPHVGTQEHCDAKPFWRLIIDLLMNPSSRTTAIIPIPVWLQPKPIGAVRYAEPMAGLMIFMISMKSRSRIAGMMANAISAAL